MISFDDFDIEEKPDIYGSDIHKVLKYIYRVKHVDKYSYNGHRYCLYNKFGSNYLGHGKWDALITILDHNPNIQKISEYEKKLITEHKILITTHYNYYSGLFRWWNIEELVNDLKRYSPESLK